jgi:lactate dehydrogenase-like 2-hydroxyacid dehydrogenase
MDAFDAPPTRVPMRVLVVSPIVDAAFAFIAGGCEALDRRTLDVDEIIGGLTPDVARGIQAVLSSGAVGFQAEHMDRLPDLKLISSFGLGYENIDLEAAKLRGIAVTNAPGTNDRTVADHAVGLMLVAARGMVETNARVHKGEWLDARKTYRPTINGARVGILGMGNIGGMIAKRVAAFDAEVAYTNRSPRPDSPYRFEPDLMRLAGWADFLVVATPGGAGTHHLVDAAVLEALGPGGILVNIGRGSVVDSAALAAALREGRLFGAGLDVVEGEPVPPPDLLAAPHVVFTPHMAGRAPVALRAQGERFLDNLARLHRGDELVCRVA